MASRQINTTIRLSAQVLQDIINEMNARQDSDDSQRRRSKRWVMQPQKMVMTLLSDNGEKTHFLAVPRNISTEGMAFLHGGYLHTGSRCVVGIRGVDCKARSIGGEIVRCTHVRSGLHDIGVKFGSAVDPREFFLETEGEYLFNAEHVQVENLEGRVLVVCESAADQRLIQHVFGGSQIEFVFAGTAEEGLEALALDPNLAFVDDSLEGMNGIDFVSEARRRGLTSPVVLIAQGSQGERALDFRMAAIGAGAKEVISKPLDPRLLHRAAAEYLLLMPMLNLDKQRMSGSACADDESKQLFGVELGERAEELRGAIEGEEMERITEQLKRLGAAAGVYGHPDLGERARTLLEKIRSGAALAVVQGEIERLAELCKHRGEESKQSADLKKSA